MSSSIRAFSMRFLMLVAICLAAVLAPLADRTVSAAPSRAVRIRSAVIQVGGETMTLDVVVQRRYVRQLNGPIAAVVTLPQATEGAIVSTDAGFKNAGRQISFQPGQSNAGVLTVNVPARTTGIPLQVVLTPQWGAAQAAPAGTNVPLSLTFYVSSGPLVAGR